MEKVLVLHSAEPRKILEAVIENKVPAIMSYLSKGKWHVAKVQLKNLGACKINFELWPREKPCPINIQVGQPVGLSVKYGYGKVIFDTTVLGFEPSAEPGKGGTVVAAVPTKLEVVERRSYFRVSVPASMKVIVTMWHRNHMSDKDSNYTPEKYLQGKLVDISAGGTQVAIDKDAAPDFKKGQFVTLRFTPMPYEQPIMFNAQIRTILPTTDETQICYGLQIVGLEASEDGQQTLTRLCNLVEQYYQMNQKAQQPQKINK